MVKWQNCTYLQDNFNSNKLLNCIRQRSVSCARNDLRVLFYSLKSFNPSVNDDEGDNGSATA